MDLLRISQDFCKKNKILPKKSYGQNFLIDRNVYSKIIESADLTKNDVVLEVGPGLGFLTEKLASKVKKVIAVEIDKTLYDFLLKRFQALGLENIELIQGDVLKLDKNIVYSKIAANLPYNISAHFLYEFLSKRKVPELMILMLQKEVVERICTVSPKLSILAISVQYFAEPYFVKAVDRQAFWPVPNVDSAIVKIARRKDKENKLDKNKEKEFFKLLRAGFSSRRKMLKNNLASIYKISPKQAENKLISAGLNTKTRAQDLSLENWKKLLGTF